MREKGACPKCKFLRRQEQRGLKRHISYSSEGLLEWLMKPLAQGEYLGCARTFNGAIGETWMSEGSQETRVARDRASAGLNQSRINLWIGTAAVCVTPRSSLLWSSLICYSLNTLRYLMYLSTSLRLKLVHTSIPKTKAGSWWRVLNLWKICLQAFGHSSSLLIFQKSSSPEMVGDVAPAWLGVSAAALGLPAAECFPRGKWSGLSWSTDSGEKLWLSGSST